MICSKCKKITDERCFATFRTKNGEIRRRGICNDCRGLYAKENFDTLKEWRKNYNQKNRSRKQQRDYDLKKKSKATIDKIKAESMCSDCGKQFHPVAMDFDHVHGKNRSIAGMVSGGYKLDLILEEIKLCEIVCACCHRIRTHIRKQNHAPIINKKDNSEKIKLAIIMRDLGFYHREIGEILGVAFQTVSEYIIAHKENQNNP